MKHIIITGGSGMVGNLVLQECLERSDVATVTVITRKTLGIAHPKLVEVIHSDFLNYTAIQHHFTAKDVCFYCIGVYTGAVADTEFNKITIDFTKVFSEILRKNNKKTTFCFLSGAGADSSEKSNVLFAKAKGIAENALVSLGFANMHIFRPGYIYPDKPRVEPNFVYTLMRILYRPVSFIYPNIGLTAQQLAHKMVVVGLNGSDKTIFENADIRK
jgi:nucleoside-diphosphate-sugar epimerase